MKGRFHFFLIATAVAILAHEVMGCQQACHGACGKSESFYQWETARLDPTNVIIDTDAGSDDAAAIITAINEEKNNPDFKIIAITCVNGNTAIDNVVFNVFKTLKTIDRLDIPVYRGASKALIITPPSDDYFGKDGFGDFDFPDPPDPSQLLQSEHAVNALIDIVNNNPGEITLLCLGPLTNVALAVRQDPTFLTKLKQLVIMGGTVEGGGNVKPGIEFNFHVDPEAAFIVLNSTDTSTEDTQPIILVPFESISERNIITMDWRKNVLGDLSSPEVLLLNKAEQYQLDAGLQNWECADCFAAAAIVDPSIIQESAKFYAYVAYDGTFSRGTVYVDYKGRVGISPNIEIVRSIDVDQYKKMLLSNIGHTELAEAEKVLNTKTDLHPTMKHNPCNL